MTQRQPWQERDFVRGVGGYYITRGPWTIARHTVGGVPKYTLYRDENFVALFPDPNEAAIYADEQEIANP